MAVDETRAMEMLCSDDDHDESVLRRVWVGACVCVCVVMETMQRRTYAIHSRKYQSWKNCENSNICWCCYQLPSTHTIRSHLNPIFISIMSNREQVTRREWARFREVGRKKKQNRWIHNGTIQVGTNSTRIALVDCHWHAFYSSSHSTQA